MLLFFFLEVKTLENAVIKYINFVPRKSSKLFVDINGARKKEKWDNRLLAKLTYALAEYWYGFFCVSSSLWSLLSLHLFLHLTSFSPSFPLSLSSSPLIFCLKCTDTLILMRVKRVDFNFYTQFGNWPIGVPKWIPCHLIELTKTYWKFTEESLQNDHLESKTLQLKIMKQREKRDPIWKEKYFEILRQKLRNEIVSNSWPGVRI